MVQKTQGSNLYSIFSWRYLLINLVVDRIFNKDIQE